MTEKVVDESPETQSKEDASAAEIKDAADVQKAVVDIKSAVNDIVDQNDLATRVSEKVLSSLKLLFEQQASASAEPTPPPEAPATETQEEQDVAPTRSHRLFRKIGKKEE